MEHSRNTPEHLQGTLIEHSRNTYIHPFPEKEETKKKEKKRVEKREKKEGGQTMLSISGGVEETGAGEQPDVID